MGIVAWQDDPWDIFLVNPAYLMSSRPVWDPASNTGRCHMGNGIWSCPLTSTVSGTHMSTCVQHRLLKLTQKYRILKSKLWQLKLGHHYPTKRIALWWNVCFPGMVSFSKPSAELQNVAARLRRLHGCDGVRIVPRRHVLSSMVLATFHGY